MESTVQITGNTIVSRKGDEFLASRLNNETMVMNMNNGDYIAINEVGTAIWDHLENPVAVSSVIASLLQQYEITEEQCSVETIHCLEQMYANGMLNVHNV